MIALMKKQLEDIRKNPGRYKALMKSGMMCAGFGGELNGLIIPNTFISGKIPQGMTPDDALRQVMEIMNRTIREAEARHDKLNVKN